MKLSEHLKGAVKVYVLKRSKKVTIKNFFVRIAEFIFFSGSFGNLFDMCYLVEFPTYWQIVIVRKNGVIELIGLDNFTFSKKFSSGNYDYEVFEEITYKLDNYLKWN